MFGYIVPDRQKLLDEEYTLFSAFYCGICKQIGLEYGQLKRLTTNYDITFFAALVFDQLNYPVSFSVERCIGNPLAKRAVVAANPLLKTIADLNIIFCYYKAEDNVIDGDKGAKTARRFLKKAFARAADEHPELDEIVKSGYERLRQLESAGEKSIDRVSDCFAGLLKECGRQIMGENATDGALGLIYNVGKFVYLADALDDVDEDSKKNRYNPFLAAFGGFEGRIQFIKSNQSGISFIMATTINRAIECFNDLSFNQSYALLKNIVHYGLRKKNEQLLSSKTKLKRPKL